MSARATLRRTFADVGPCSASAATFSDTSSTRALRRCGLTRDPAQARVCGRPTESIVREPADGAVVDDPPILVAPGRIDDLPRLQTRGAARDHAIDDVHGIGTGDEVLEERRDVEERGAVANRVVLVFVQRFVRARRVVARPVAVAQARAERERPVVKRRPDRHGGDYRQCWVLGAQCLVHCWVPVRLTTSGLQAAVPLDAASLPHLHLALHRAPSTPYMIEPACRVSTTPSSSAPGTTA